MDAIEAIRGRRSVRRYRGTAIDSALIEAVITDAAHAPWTPVSVPHPWVFTVVSGKERLSDLGSRALAYARENRPQRAGYGWLDDPRGPALFAMVRVGLPQELAGSRAIVPTLQRYEKLFSSLLRTTTTTTVRRYWPRYFPRYFAICRNYSTMDAG